MVDPVTKAGDELDFEGRFDGEARTGRDGSPRYLPQWSSPQAAAAR
jgi:hypothetical protein